MIILALSVFLIFIIVIGVVIAFAFKEKAGTGQLNEKDSIDYSMKNIESKKK